MNLPPSLASTYSLINPIGFGTFSTVYLAVHNPTKSYVAIKIISNEKFKSSSSFRKDIKEDEVKILQKLSNHPFITKIYAFTQDEDSNIYIVMEYVEGGNLFQLINLNCPPLLSYLSSLSSYSISMKKVAFQLYLILKHLDKNKIVHRDIKSENILIDKHNNLRLADFGLAIDLSDLSSSSIPEIALSSPVGTPQYMAPEIIRGQNYGRPADVWSTGVVLYCCAVGTFPFQSQSSSISNQNSADDPLLDSSNTDNKAKLSDYHYNIFYSILNDDVTFPEGHVNDSNLEDLIRRMLTKDQKDRITVEEMGNHPFIKSASDLIEKVEQSIENDSFISFSLEPSLNVDTMIIKREQQTESMQAFGIIEQSDATRIETDKHKKTVQKVQKEISKKGSNPMAFLAKSIAHSGVHPKKKSSSGREKKKFV